MKHSKRICVLVALLALLCSGAATAQLDYGKDYTTSDSLMQVTNIRVHSNMMDTYFEGIKQTWVASNELAKEMGQIADYAVYVSELPNSGHHNLSLVVMYDNWDQYNKGRVEFEKFEKAWEKKMPEDKQRMIVNNYPSMREIVGEYLMRAVDFK